MRSSNPNLGLIVCTNTTCKFSGRSWEGIPTLIWPDGIDEDASDWLRALVVENGVAISSAREYAKIIRPFLRFCRKSGRTWQSVDDAFLILWREHQLRTKKISSKRVNASLNAVFAFYKWAEETKRIRFHVGIYPLDELPAAIAGITFPISAKRSYTKGQNGRVYGGWTTPLTLGPSEGGHHSRHTPTEHEIRDIHGVAVERIHGERDSLMLSWAEEVGLRRAEFMRLCKSQLPSPHQLTDLIERDEPWKILSTRKGGKSKYFTVLPELLIRTADYIQFGRRDIVNNCRDKIVGYREPDEIFLSSTTGMPLHLDSVTAIGRDIFAEAGVERANIHRLRARYAVRTIEAMVDAIFDGTKVGTESSWVETILTKAAEQMGHTSPQSLRPYLTGVLNRRIQTADASKAERLASCLRQLSRHEDTLKRRLKHQTGLHRSSELIQAGRNADAAAILRKIADQLD